jgi:GNAT superfamily N-acetyltransferase
MPASPVTVRPALETDAAAIYKLGTKDTAFRVSDAIPFYEESELRQWATDRANNVLLVLEHDNKLTGFLFCKIISQHWAMLDNYYIVKEHRGTENASRLIASLLDELKRRGLTYLTCLIREDHKSLARLARRFGFSPRSRYTWFELFLTHRHSPEKGM